MVYLAAVQVVYRRGQAQGDIYVIKSEIRHGSIDSMSKDEVLKALEEIKNSYAPVTIDITPEENDSREEGERILQTGKGSGAKSKSKTVANAN